MTGRNRDYTKGHKVWARLFSDNWKASLRWQRLNPYEKFAEMIESHWSGCAWYYTMDISVNYIKH
ncbi:MAG: transposase [Candidatus Scalindua sp.]|nr:transposase [Candidatus Scalindua sp.]